MIHDDVLKMEAGREMDALVAEKVMGLSYILFDGTDPHQEELTPHYSTDIAAAWEVVEKLRKSYDVVIDLDDELASCRILKRVNDEWIREIVVEQIFESTPYAICRAALLAVCAISRAEMDGKK